MSMNLFFVSKLIVNNFREDVFMSTEIVKWLQNLYGYGFAKIVLEDGLYKGKTSRGDSTARFEKLSDCIRELWKMGYK